MDGERRGILRIYETEEEQLEALALWWQRWRLAIGIGLAAILATGLAYSSWQSWRADLHRQAYDLHEQVLEITSPVREGLEALEQPEPPPPEGEEAEPPAATREQLQQQLEPALKLASDMLEQFPRAGYSWMAVLHLAPLAIELDFGEQGSDLLRRAIESTGDFWSGNESFNGLFRLHLARYLAGKGDFEAALGWLESDSLEAYSALADNLRGDLLAETGQLEEAKQAWQRVLEETEDNFFRSLVEVKISSWSIFQASDAPVELPVAPGPDTSDTQEAP